MYCNIVSSHFPVFKTSLEVWYLTLRTGNVHGINGGHTGRAMDSRAGSSKAHLMASYVTDSNQAELRTVLSTCIAMKRHAEWL